MNELTPECISCPYCGERIELLLNPDDLGDSYIEDCQVCCRPMTISLLQDDAGNLRVEVCSENDVSG